MWLFGSTAYTYIPAEVSTSKLQPRSVKVQLLGYYGHEAYKLLDQDTGKVLKSRDVIFEEGEINYAKQPEPTRFDIKEDLFSTNSQQPLQHTKASEYPENKGTKTLKPVSIVPQPHDMPSLHL